MRIRDKRCFYVTGDTSGLPVMVADPIKQTFKTFSIKTAGALIPFPVGRVVINPSSANASVQINGVTQEQSTPVNIPYGPSTVAGNAYSGLKAGDIVNFAKK